MLKYDIDLNTLLSMGHVITETTNEMLHITTTKRIATDFDKVDIPVDSYVYIPEAFKLPLRIDLTIKIDAPGLYLLLENGHLNFGTPFSDNRRIDDIIEPNLKPRFFHNHIPINEFVDITVIYGFDAMQILINGEERYYSVKEKYMKSKSLKELNSKGFILKIACSKRTNLIIKSFTITEFDEMPEILHNAENLPKPLVINEAVGLDQKPNLENCISLLSQEIQEEIMKTDYFLRSLKPMKFKRQVEKHGNKITYLSSDYGFSYLVYPSNDIMTHSLSWYIITNGKPELWHRKADMMEETLNKLAESSPELADKLFTNLLECIVCSQCIVKTAYEYKGQKKLTCHGKMEFKMCISDFEDVRIFINTVNELVN